MVEGGQATSAVADLYGTIGVSSKGVAWFTSVNWGGNLTVAENGSAVRTSVYEAGDMHVSSGGFALSTCVSSGGDLNISFGGVADMTTVRSSGWVCVYDDGLASRTDVFSGGRMYVSSGGTANNTYLTGKSAFDSVYGGALFLLAGGRANSTTVNEGGRMYVSSGGKNNWVTVYSGGILGIKSGGKLTGMMFFSSGASVTVSSGGIIDFDMANASAGGEALVNDLSVISGSPKYTMTVDEEHAPAFGDYILAGGAAGFDKTISVQNALGGWFGTLQIGQAVSVNDVKYTLLLNGSEMIVKVEENNLFTGVVKKYTTISSGTTAVDVTITAGGHLVILFGCEANRASINGGQLTVSIGGVANSTTIKTYGKMYVSSGGNASSTTVDGDYARLEVFSGGTANDTTLNSGSLHISSGGTANNTSVNSGSLHISSGGSVIGAVVSGGYVDVMSEGVLSDATVASARVSAYSGARLSGVYLGSGGILSVESGCIAQHIIVSSGGVVSGVLRNAELTFYGGTLDFDISEAAPAGEFIVDADTTLNTEYGMFCTLTVKSSQENGTYNLIENAYGFDTRVITASTPLTVNHWNRFTLGTLSIGQTATFEGKDYTLNLSDDYHLTVTISGSTPQPPTPPTPGDKSFFTGDFNGDLFDTLAAQKGSTVTIYQNGEAWGLGLTLDTGWSVVGTGDFNGDKIDDFLRVNTEGYVVGEMSNGNGTFTPQVLNLKNTGWNILGTGNFDGVGPDDVLIANPTAASETVGLLGYWKGGTEWTLINGYSPEWECVSTGDFNGDGKCDMLWKNSFEGEGGLTYNAYCTWIVEDPVDWRMVSVANPDEWNFLCSGDFDGNGSHDIAMINNVGVVGIWGVSDGYLSSWSILSAVTSEWQLAGVADFNADGTDDIAWSNTDTGLTGYWQINNKELTTWANIAAL